MQMTSAGINENPPSSFSTLLYIETGKNSSNDLACSRIMKENTVAKKGEER